MAAMRMSDAPWIAALGIVRLNAPLFSYLVMSDRKTALTMIYSLCEPFSFVSLRGRN